jgi:hypothetical protein
MTAAAGVLRGARRFALRLPPSIARTIVPAGGAGAFPPNEGPFATHRPNRPMSVIHRTITALALACGVAGPLAAQLPRIPLAVEARGGIAQPADAFTGADGGAAGEVSATLHALPFIGVYGAYQHNRFAWGENDGHLTDSGWAAGVRVGVPLPLIPIDPWIRAGVVMHDLEGTSSSAEGRRGWEAGGGLGFPLARGLTLTPGVLWTRYPWGSGAQDGPLLRVRHLRTDVGLRLRF